MEYREAPESGSEKETLVAFLDNQRAIMQWKLEGLTVEQGQQTTGHSDTSLFGLVKHMAVVERWWFVANFKGERFEHPYDFEADRDAEFRPYPDDTVESIIADYDAAIATADAIIEAADLDDLAVKQRRNTGNRPSMRWILVHMIEETARHAGHADILREIVDDTTGYLPES
jgi:hypothetical protein